MARGLLRASDARHDDASADSPRTNIVPKKKNGAPHGNKNASRLGPGVRAALAHLVANPDATIKQACAAVGCGERTFYDAQHSDAFAAHLRSLARGRIKSTLALKALHRFDKLIDAESEYVAADIAKDVLAQAGVRERVDGAVRPAATGGVRITFISSAAQPGATAVQIDVDTAQTSSKSEG